MTELPGVRVVITADTRPLQRALIDCQMIVAGPIERVRLRWLRWKLR